MKNRIQNQLHIQCSGTNLMEDSNIELYIKQGSLLFQYIPRVIDETSMLVVIPFEDAIQLKQGKVLVQLAFMDKYKNPIASEITRVEVTSLLKENGYDPE